MMLLVTMKEDSGTVMNDIKQILSLFEKWQQNIWGWLINIETWELLIIKAIKIVLIILVTRVMIRILNRLINYVIIKQEQSRLNSNSRRLLTIKKLFKNITTLSINFVMILLTLSEFNINLAPLIVSAGVIGLAIGFGAQNLVKDVITGFFIILEDHFAVGDIIKVGSFQGTVEVIGLRSTRIHSWTGEVYVIPNGSITEVTNYSLNNSIAVVDVSIAYKENVEHVIEIMNKALELLPERNKNVLKVPQVLGIQTLGRSEVTLRIIIECRPFTQSGVIREMNGDLKKTLEKEGIRIYYPHFSIYKQMEQGTRVD